MIHSNPSAALEHFLWNLSLTFNGFQVGLFNAMSGTVNPDYAPVYHATYALALSLIALGIVFAAAIKAGRDWNFWWQTFFRERLSLWLLMLSVLCVAIPVILVQRPRPSYLFSVTLVLMGIIGMAVNILLSPRGQRLAKALAVVGVVVLIVVVPSYYVRHRSDRPLYAAFERLRPFGSIIETKGNKVLFGDYNGELRGYLHLRRNDSTYDYGLLKSWQPPQRLEHFLDEKQVNVAFIQPRVTPELRARPEARAFLDDPESVGWRRLAPPAGSDESWLLLYKEPPAPTQ